MTNLFTKLAGKFIAVYLTLLLILVSSGLQAQVSVTSTAGSNLGPQNYLTVNAAFAAINAGTHQGAINIAISATTAETTPPTVLAASGVGLSSYTSITIYPTTPNVAIAGSSNVSTGILVFNGADNITINGNLNNGTGTTRDLEIQNNQGGATPGSHAVLWFQGSSTAPQLGSTNIVIKNTLIRANGNPNATSATSPYVVGLAFAGTSFPASTSTGLNHQNITLDNNLFQKAGTAIQMGNSTTIPITGLNIINNVIGSNDAPDYVYHRGMWLSNTSAALIKQNHIFNIIVGTAQTVTRVGMEITGTGSTSAMIERNHIHSLANFNTGGYAGYGIVLSGGSNHTIVNNLIYDITGTSWNTSTVDAATGIRMTTGTGHKLYYNSINLYGALTGTGSTTTPGCNSAAVVISSTVVTGVDIRNNILNNKSTSPNVPNGEHLAIWFPASYNFAAAGNIFNNNGYYVTGGSSNHYVAKVGITSGSGLHADLSALQALTGQDAQSMPLVNSNAPFTADNILTIPAGTITPLESGGVVISALPIPNTDYSGFNRPAGTGTAPDVGAFEFEGALPSGCSTTPDAGSATISQTTICNGQGVDLTLSGQTVDIGIEINWQQSSSIGGPFTDIPGAIDPVYSTGPLSADMHFRARVSCANATPSDDYSNVVSVTVNNPAITSTTTAQRCGPGSVTLNATADPQYDINWYENQTGGAPVATGPSFTTPVLSNSTTYYVAANLGGGIFPAGKQEPSPATNLLASPRGLIFNASQQLTLLSVKVFSTSANAGDGTITLYDNANNILSGPVPVSWPGGGSTASPVPHVLNLNFLVPPGTGHKLIMSTFTTGGIGYQTSGITGTWSNYGTPGGEVEITSSATSLTGISTSAYYYFFDWQVAVGCEGTRVPVTATINAAPALTLTPDETVCSEEIIQLNITSNVNDFDTYQWSPIDDLYLDAAASNPYIGGSATTLYFKSSTAGAVTYTVNAFNNTTTCSGIATTEIFVQPSVVPVASSNVSEVCVSGIVNFSINPAIGYAPGSIYWQESTDNVTYTDIPGANSATYSTTVSSSSYYRAEVRNSTVCSQSNSVFILRNNPEVLSTTPGSRCGIGTVDLGATGSTGASLNWYESATGGLPLATGNSFTTPIISSTTDFYVAASSGGGGVASAGLLNAISTTGYTLEAGLFFDAISDFTIDGVYVYPMGTGAGTATIALQNSSGTTLQSIVANLTGTVAPHVKTYVPLNFNVTPGNDYRLVMLSRAGSVSGLIRESGSSWGSYPLTLPGTLNITAGKCCPDAISTSYYYFYDWQVSTGCESARLPVTATVNTPPALEVTGDFQICDGASTTLTVTTGASDYTSFVWSPATGLNTTTGTSVVANPAENTEYTVLASGNVNGCQNEDVFTVEVIHVDVDITSDISPVCGSTPANLTSSVFSEAATYNISTFSNTTLITIPAGAPTTTSGISDPYPSSINIAGVSPVATVKSIKLNNVTHTFPGDIDIVVVSPSGQAVIIMSDAGGGNDISGVTYTFSDDAPAALGTGLNPTGTYLPSNLTAFTDAFAAPGPGSITQNPPSLSMFTGNPNGVWSLYIVDDSGTDVGQVAGGWEIEFSEPNSFTYNWSPTTGLSSSTIANPTALPPIGSTTYTLTVTESNSGCVGSSDITIHRADPQVVSSSDDTRCGLGEVNLSASGQTGETIAWWESTSADQPLHIGNNFDPFVTNTTTYFASSIGAALTTNISTGFDANIVGTVTGATAGGNMFDVVAYGDLIIQSFDVHLHNDVNLGPSDISVYVKQGSYVGSQLNASAWTLVGSVSGVTSAGIGVPTPLPLNINLKVLNGQTYGVYIAVTNLGTGNPLRYNNSAASPPLGTVAGGDANLEVLVGTANFGPFTTNVIAPDNRKWNGRVHYSLFCESPRVPVTATVTPAPIVEVTGGPFMCEGEPITLTVSTGANDYTSFEWSPATGLSNTTGTSVVASPTQSTSYIVFASGNTNGCQTTDTIDVIVSSAPQLTVSSQSGTFFCDVANTQLIADAGAGAENVGAIDNSMGTISSYGTDFYYMAFDVLEEATIESINIYPTAPIGSNSSIEIKNSSGTVLFNVPYTTTVTGGNVQTIPLNVTIPIGTGYRMHQGSNYIDLNRNTAGASYPYTSSNIIITGNNFSTAYYYWFYNWQIAGSAVSYQWSPSIGLSDPTIADPIATPTTTTTYTILVTDTITGCTSTESITIIVEPTPVPVITSSDIMPLCAGETTVLTTQYLTGDGYQFSWNGGLYTTESILAEVASIYEVIVTSPNGCVSYPVNFTVEIANIFADIGTVTDVLCYGGSDGSVEISVLGSIIDPTGIIYFGPFDYAVNGGPLQSSPLFTGLAAGNYTFEVHDPSTGCVSFIPGTVGQPDPLTVTTTVLSNVSCLGGSNGSASAQGSGGVGPYTYNWLTPIPKQLQTNDEIPAGTWTVVVEDANGCTATATVTITEPTQLSVSLGGDDVVPYGMTGFSGCKTITPVVSGGTVPYGYSWTSNDPNLPVGYSGTSYTACHTVDTIYNYIVVVTDANGCTGTDTLELIFANVNCANNNNGTKITICHVPPGNPSGCKTICIAVSAAPALLAQGSYVGPCLKKCAIPASTRLTAPEVGDIMLEVSPNPTTGRLNIEFISNAQSPTHITVTDLQGRMVLKVALNGSSSFTKEISLDKLENGLYLLNIINNEGVISTSRVVKTQ